MKRHKTATNPAPGIAFKEIKEVVGKATDWARKHPADPVLSGFRRPKTWRWARLYPKSGSPDPAPGTLPPS